MSGGVTGKVAKIIDDKTIVINRGASAGVKENMRFSIVTEGDEVVDPDSGTTLGKWEAVKGYVQATHVQDNLTVCTAVEKLSLEEAKTAKTLSAAMVDVSFVKPGSNARLNVQSSDVSGRPNIGPIRVGDIVRSIQS
jgi:hypothetical protein